MVPALVLASILPVVPIYVWRVIMIIISFIIIIIHRTLSLVFEKCVWDWRLMLGPCNDSQNCVVMDHEYENYVSQEKTLMPTRPIALVL